MASGNYESRHAQDGGALPAVTRAGEGRCEVCMYVAAVFRITSPTKLCRDSAYVKEIHEHKSSLLLPSTHSLRLQKPGSFTRKEHSDLSVSASPHTRM